MTPAPSPHHLDETVLSALGVGEFTVASIRKLAAAESSKHALLLEAIRRASNQAGPAEGGTEITNAISVLAEVQARAPGVISEILALPQLGFWAADCLTRLRAGRPGEPAPSLSADLGHLAGFAAVAALRAGHHCELKLPVRDGRVFFPALGVARLAGQRGAGRAGAAENAREAWACLRIDTRGAKVVLGARSVSLPVGSVRRPPRAGRHWSPVRRLRARSAGITLEVILEDADPFLTRLGPPVARGTRHQLRAWRRRFRKAWRILTRHHRTTALGLASGLTTLVPLQAPDGRRPFSATSGLAWGAIAVSLPQDALDLAEALIHEFHHLVLSAIDDVTPLLSGDRGELRYAPWRDDPRPLDGLIQGAYAYLGLARFWRQQRHTGRRRLRRRGEVEFARERRAALRVARGLAGQAALTDAGRCLVTAMVSGLNTWQQDAVPAWAEAMACEAAAEHWLRWRLAHLRPHARTVEVLARAWVAGAPQATAAAPLPVTVVPWTRAVPDGRSRLLALRYRDPRRLRRELRDGARVDASDAALLRGDAAGARAGYLNETRPGVNAGGWVGLIIARRRLAGRQAEWVLAEQPDVIAAVYERVTELTGVCPDAEALITWLTARP
jgi:HEXXH motif-containing protein